jgi:hypothetical protein
MFARWLRRWKGPQVVHVDEVIFRGEQDGITERQLKCELSKLFESRSDIQSAFLAIVSYQNGLENSVALCATGILYQDRPDFVKDVGTIFAKIFSTQVHLDVLFPSTAQQHQLEQVCRPFFVGGRS